MTHFPEICKQNIHERLLASLSKKSKSSILLMCKDLQMFMDANTLPHPR